MTDIASRAAAVLGGNGQAGSTGVRKNRTPLLDAMSKLLKVAAVGSVVLVGACANNPHYGGGHMGTKETWGTLGGAALGGLAGAQFGKGNGKLASTALGALLGAVAGNAIGKSLDRADRMYMEQAEFRAYGAPLGQRVQWQNPQSGNHGYIAPIREGVHPTGAYCREYQMTVFVGGQPHQGYGTACRQPDGSWRVMSAAESPDASQFASIDAAAPGHEALAAAAAPGPRMG